MTAVIAAVIAALAGILGTLGWAWWRDRDVTTLEQVLARREYDAEIAAKTEAERDAAMARIIADPNLSHDERAEQLRALVERTIAHSRDHR